MKGLQKFTPEYLAQSRRMSPDAVARFLDDFRRLHAPRAKSRLISMKVPETLLAAFRHRCRVEGERYQTKIKALMLEWVEGKGP
jgi:predicted DNA binding CopG/RHH family protein